MEKDNLNKNPQEQGRGEPAAENPYRLSGLKLTKAATWAAGAPVVMAAMSNLVEEKTFY